MWEFLIALVPVGLISSVLFVRYGLRRGGGAPDDEIFERRGHVLVFKRGKHADRALGEVAFQDPEYLVWMLETAQAPEHEEEIALAMGQAEWRETNG